MGAGFDPMMLSRFQRSMAELSPKQQSAFESMRLDPEKLAAKPLEAALSEVAAAFDNIKNPADRANIAVELFGKSGAEMIPTLKLMQEYLNLLGEHEIIKPEDVARSNALGNSWKNLKNTMADMALTAMQSPAVGALDKISGGALGGGNVNAMTKAMRLFSGGWAKGKDLITGGDSLDKLAAQWESEDRNIQFADINEKKRIGQQQKQKRSDLVKEQSDKADKILQNMDDELGGENAVRARKRSEFADTLKGDPLKEAKLWAYDYRISALDSQKQRQEEQRERDQERQRQRHEADSLTQAMERPEEKYSREMDHDQDLFKKQMLNAETLSRLKKKHLDDYYREVKSQKSSLGISDPLSDYADNMTRLAQARQAGDITNDEFQKAAKRLRKSATSALKEETPAIHSLGAMALGSREAHALMTQLNIGDPKTKLAADTVKQLQDVNNKLAQQLPVLRQLVKLFDE